ncbi:MAG TPA: hypothetical protein P5567_14140 [Kiritimatiellia bacterium]|nr:hypothetical protein [Kiritimatiellia bacterium]HRZ13582.1 hypothetical protein [Kiritimatiellia bacterium]HSA19322.1 hypothetical protein [Kiritimatiellia bacterium]
MSGPEFKTLEEMAQATAARLSQAASHAAFHLFQDKRFRELAEFGTISQEEQDRIFNELVLAFLVMIMLVLEAPDLRLPDDIRDHLDGIKDRLPRAYLDQLKEMGVEERFIADWDKLIALRYEEYARDRHDVRAAAMQIESTGKDLSEHDLARIQLLVPVQSAAIGSHHHVCRGKTDGRDELFKTMLRALSHFYVELRTALEIGKIGPLARARRKLARFFRA